ncbi:MAG TPA: hypothetical protein VJ742_08340 [Nitrososphaera sp.]|nr:hypothetical protein [Nitrososphaera sp.]
MNQPTTDERNLGQILILSLAMLALSLPLTAQCSTAHVQPEETSKEALLLALEMADEDASLYRRSTLRQLFPTYSSSDGKLLPRLGERQQADLLLEDHEQYLAVFVKDELDALASQDIEHIETAGE